MTEPDAPSAAEPPPAALGAPAEDSPPRPFQPPPPPLRAAAQPPEPRPTRDALLPWLCGLGFLVLAGAIGFVWWSLQQPQSQPSADLQALAERVARLEQRPEPSGGAVDLGPLTARVAALDQRATPDLAPLEARVAALNQRLAGDNGFAARLDALSGRVDALSAHDREALDDLGHRLDVDDARLAALDHAQALMTVMAKQIALRTRIQAAQAALAAGQPLGELPDAPPAVARFAAANPPTEASLRQSYAAAERAALAASRQDTDAKPLVERLLAQTGMIVRQGDRVLIGDSAISVLARAHTALDAGDLSGAVAAVSGLSGRARCRDGRLARRRQGIARGPGRAGRHGRTRLMRRVLYVLVACGLVLALAWVIAGLPGRVTAQFGATIVDMPTPVAAVGLVLLFAVLYVVLRLLGGMLRLPGIAARWDAEHDRRRGDVAVSRALLALAAGDKADARREAGRARRWLGDTPQTLLLAAEAGRLAGRDDEAEDAFRRLADRPDAAFLGYRGLMRQALTRQDWTEAAALARQAQTAHPGAEWLRLQRARLAIRGRHWTEALDLVDTDAARAALAAGAAEAEQDPGRAMKLARQAWKADASLAPAALAYATRLRADGREARAQAVIRHSWALAPHPDLAAFALAPVTDRLARARAAQRLAEANPDHPESRLLLARTALDAGLTGEARHQAMLARDAGLNQRRLWLLLAEIAEADQGEADFRPACRTGRAAPGRHGGPRPGMALHRVPYAACRLVSGLHVLRCGWRTALDARQDGALSGAGGRGLADPPRSYAHK